MFFVEGSVNIDNKGILYLQISKEVLMNLPYNSEGKTCLHINEKGSIRAFAPEKRVYINKSSNIKNNRFDELDEIEKELII